MPTSPRPGRPTAAQGEWGVPKTWQQVQAVTKFLKGKKINGQDAYGYLDPPKPWGGFGFYFLGSRATAYAKHPDDKAWLFDADTMKPRVNNPAWVRAIQDVIDALPSEPADQINADPEHHRLPAVPGRHRLDARLVGRRRLQRQDQRHLGGRRRRRLLDPAGLGRRLQFQDRRMGQARQRPELRAELAYLGWGIYVMARVDSDEKKQKAAWSAAAHLGGKDLSLWTAAYPSGFQPYRNCHFNIRRMGGGRLRRGVHHRRISNSQSDSYNHPNAAIEPRIPGIFQYYTIAEDELAKIFAGKMTAQEGRRRHRRRLGEAHRPDRPRQPDQALQGLARHVG